MCGTVPSGTGLYHERTTIMAEAKKKKLETSKQKVADKAPKPVKAKTNDETLIPNTEKPVTEPKPLAKAGKRSVKAIKEAEALTAKKERLSADDAPKEAKPKQPSKPARSVLERKSKKFRKAAESIESNKLYAIKDALLLATKTSPVKFDATVEVHARLGVDPRQADQNLRDTIVMPAGTGKTLRIAVVGDVNDVTAAKKAGADIAGGDEFLQQLEKGVIEFDILICTPSMMPKLGKFARVLGPKGLMPNPKSGTITTDVAKAVKESKAGKVEYRVDSTGIVHVGVGKVSFGADKLMQNTTALFDSIKSNKPTTLKGNYIKSIYITTSMGPSIPVDLTSV